MRNHPSEQLLDLMRGTHGLQASHVKLLESEIRELIGRYYKPSNRALAADISMCPASALPPKADTMPAGQLSDAP